MLTYDEAEWPSSRSLVLAGTRLFAKLLVSACVFPTIPLPACALNE